MTEKLKEIKNLIAEGSTEHAIDQLNQLINLNPEYAAEAYYLLGNAFRKKGDWQGALNNYQEAIALNPDSPAAEARNMVMDILNFYNERCSCSEYRTLQRVQLVRSSLPVTRTVAHRQSKSKRI